MTDPAIPITAAQLMRLMKSAFDDGQRQLAEVLVEAGYVIPPAAMAIVSGGKTFHETMEEVRKEILK